MVPEINETIFQLPHGFACNTHVRVTPLVREGIADVVATYEADVAVDYQDLAVILACAANIQRKETRPQGRELTHVQVRHVRELVKTRILVQDAETVPHAKHLDTALSGREQRILEPLPPSSQSAK